MKRLNKSAVLIIMTAFSVIWSFGQGSVPTENKEKPNIKTGVLLLAHGGKQNWNDEVMKLALTVGQRVPVEVAFGMATRQNIQAAVDRLTARGVEHIVAVPLFVSSHSSVVTSTEYLLGLRAEAPPELAAYAKMSHGSDHGMHGDHAGMVMADARSPVKSTVPIKMTPALNSHPIVAEILLSRAAKLSSEPKKEVVVVVAHGPVAEDENKRWLADMGKLVEMMRVRGNYKRIEYLTVRDDAPEPIRSQATAELRSVVERATKENSNVLIVPLLLAYGGIEEGIKKRLEGLTYLMSSQALLPDDRLAQWVLQSVNEKTGDRASASIHFH